MADVPELVHVDEGHRPPRIVEANRELQTCAGAVVRRSEGAQYVRPGDRLQASKLLRP